MTSDEFTLSDGTKLRVGMRGYLKNPFTPEEEIVFGDPPEQPTCGRTLRITKIDLENRTVTLE